MMAIGLLALRSLLFAIVFYIGSILYVLAGIPAAFIGERPLQAVVTGWSRFHGGACRWILGQKVRVVGTLPEGPMLFIFKHESMFETIDLPRLLPIPVVVAKKELIDIPLWGWVATRYGVVGLERAGGASALRALMRRMREIKATGRPVCLFPEGTRVPHGQRPELRSGFAGLYQLLGLPVVPVAVDSGKLSPRGKFLKRPGIITYKVGEILPPGLPREEAEARVHIAINALNSPTGDAHARAT